MLQFIPVVFNYVVMVIIKTTGRKDVEAFFFRVNYDGKGHNQPVGKMPLMVVHNVVQNYFAGIKGLGFVAGFISGKCR